MSCRTIGRNIFTVADVRPPAGRITPETIPTPLISREAGWPVVHLAAEVASPSMASVSVASQGRSRLVGPLLTVVLVLGVELLSAQDVEVHGLGAILLVAVVFAVLSGGLVAGVLSGILGVVYFTYHYAEPGSLLSYSAENVERLAIDVLSSVVVLAVLGGIKARLDEQTTLMASLRAAAETERTRLRGILESITDGFFSVDRQWRYTYVNTQAERIVGKPRGELLGVAMWDAFPPLKGSVWDREFHRAFETGAPVHFEAFYPPLDTWFETHAYPSEEGLTIYLRPINDRKRAEQLLRARVKQQATVAALGQFALEEPDLDALFDTAVRALSETLGVELVKILELSPDQRSLLLKSGVGWQDGLLGHTWVDASKTSQAGYTLLQRSPVIVEDLETETRFDGPELLKEHGVTSGMSVTIDGSPAPFGVLGVHTRADRVFSKDDADFLRAVAQLLAQAIERHKMALSLAEREALFRDLAENIHEVFFVTEPDAVRTTYVSPAYEALFGRRCEEAIEKPLSWVDVVHPDDRSRVEAGLAELAKTGFFHDEFRIVRPDGSERWVLDRAFPVRSPTGDIVRIVGLVEDITARKQAEEAARRLAEEQMSRAAAEAAVHARDEVLAIISHDLRNPLSTITVAAQAMQMEEHQDDRHFAAMIERAAKHMTRLVNDLLDASRVEAGRLSVDLQPLDLGQIVSEVCDSMNKTISDKGVQLSVDVTPDLPVEADSGRMSQVLTNLIDNALKFTPAGGTITVRSQPEDSEVHLSVSDTGPGIPPEDVPHLFERFWQARRTDRRGIGLGLPIVKGIVDAHRGRLWVETAPGSGTTFHIALARAEAARKAALRRQA